ncbi:dedicator of cytokinesis protein 7-like isoform X2 [Corticium candelabrum]|uniref:dedicator of cytokinesis protein 7-like isoform X2 n=1 Tax=Corticium candelabrum TaxID=121492 RepID=UPI002E25AF2C|nr:dedicator of cytokinesis protein 7-like isoform X2 [Corticium candelabrum]
MSGSRRAFAAKLNKAQGAAEARRDASETIEEIFTNTTFSSSSPDILGSFSTATATPLSLNEIVNPINYEEFVEKHQSVMDKDPLRDMLVFPKDDIEVVTVSHRFRTTETPVPQAAQNVKDIHVKECVSLYLTHRPLVNRKYNSSYGGQTLSMSRMSRASTKAPDFLRTLARHEFEVDGVMPDETDDGHSGVQRKMSITSNISLRSSQMSMMYDLQSSEEDPLLENVMDIVHPDKVDGENEMKRTQDRHQALFSIYPMPDEDDYVDRRLLLPSPTEHFGYRVMVKCLELRLDLEIEPIFAMMAFYDAKERKKISENFHFDLNRGDISKMLSVHGVEKCMPSVSRSAIFSITYPNQDVYLVVKLEKVLQQGDISECADPYMRDLDSKTHERVKYSAAMNCERLGKYRMPFAWTAINLIDILQGSTNMGGGVGNNTALPAEVKGNRDSTLSEQRSSTPEPPRLRTASEPGRRNTGSSMSTSDMKRSATMAAAENHKEEDNTGLLLSHFKPVTLTVNSFFKQEGEKLEDEDLYRFLLDLKRPTSTLKRLKCIPGTLKIDISLPGDNQSCCLTPSLLQVSPYPDPHARPTREIEEFPPKEVFVPWTVYKNFLYVYPQSVNFSSRGGSARNIAIKIQIMEKESEQDAMKIIYGKSSSAKFHKEAWTAVTYHNKAPDFYEEVKIELPPDLEEQYHLLFTFYHISCHKPTKPQDNPVVEPTFIGYTWLPLVKEGSLQTGDFNLPVAVDKPHANYSRLPPEVALPGVKWMDSHKPVFRLSINTVSSIHSQDSHLRLFFDHCHAALAGEAITSPVPRPPSVVSETGSFSSFVSMASKSPELQAEEKLVKSIEGLRSARGEKVVHFLHLLLNKLFQLLVRPAPPLIIAGVKVSEAVFESLTDIANRLHHLLADHCDLSGRNILLAQFVQYIFQHPQVALDKASTEAGHETSEATQSNKTKGLSNSNPDLTTGESDLSFTRNTEKRATFSTSPGTKRSLKLSLTTDKPPSPQPAQMLVHEELAAQWVACRSSVKEKTMAHGWFFFDVIVKSVAQYLHKAGRLGHVKKPRLSSDFHDNISKIVKLMSQEIVKKHIKESKLARHLNTSLAFFVHDALSLMDRGYVFDLMRIYLRQISAAVADFNLREFKLELFRIVCNHEHFVTLNLPLDINLSLDLITSPTFPSPPLSPLQPLVSYKLSHGSTVSTQQQNMAELTREYRQQHFLVGLVLTELAKVFENQGDRKPSIQRQAISLVRDLMARHDFDIRYTDVTRKARVASLYFPLLGIVMDSWQWLYKGSDSSDSWSVFSQYGPLVSESEGNGTLQSYNTTNTANRFQSVSETPQQSSGTGTLKSQSKLVVGSDELTPESTRNLLACFLWILKSIDSDVLTRWWSGLSISRLSSLLAVLDLCVACFEYKGRKAIQAALGVALTGSDMQTRLTETIMGVGSARALMMRRRQMGGDSGIKDTGRRWGITYRKESSRNQDSSRPPIDIEFDAAIESNLATECSLILLDTLERLIETTTTSDSLHHLLARVLTILLHFLSCHQSAQALSNIFATQRALVCKFPELLFEEETEQCAELCTILLRHCSSALVSTRSQATASLYLLMRQNYETGASFARIKVQVTVALSTIVGGVQQGLLGQQTFNPEFLRRSLKTLITYAKKDQSMAGTTFPDQVNDLAANLNMILVDTVKMNESKEDHQMLLDLMHRIANGYQNSPDLRLTWLQNMAGKHSEQTNHCEAAMCMVHAAALVSEYLYLIEDCACLPRGCVAFQAISLNVLEESAISDDITSPDEDGICTGKLFSESGIVGLLTQAAVLFESGSLYESAAQVYKILIPIHEANRSYKDLAKLHGKLQHLYFQITEKGARRVLGSYFRIAFYGELLDDLNGAEFIYREQSLTQLAEISLRLQTLYSNRYKPHPVEIIKDSSKVDPSTLEPGKIYVQVTFVEPYFDRYELKSRVTAFDKNFNIRRFVYSTPFTKSGKAHGDVEDQWKRKTILTTANPLPYVKTRVKVISREEIELTPVEVAIEDMSVRTRDLKQATSLDPPDPKLLQVQLQGAISTTVNQGPFEIASKFLSDREEVGKSHHLQKLCLCFREFTLRCGEALERNKHLIGEDQREYQREMERNYITFKERLSRLLPDKRGAAIKTRRRSRETSLLQKISRGSGFLENDTKTL